MTWKVLTYRSEARTIETDAFGAVDIPEGFEWRVGAGAFCLPDVLVSEALKEAACVHDFLYRGHRTGQRLHAADRTLIEVYWRMGGSPWNIPAIWIAVRAWAWKTVIGQFVLP